MQRAAALLTDPDRCSPAVVLKHLEWLTQADPAAALPVLRVSALVRNGANPNVVDSQPQRSGSNSLHDASCITGVGNLNIVHSLLGLWS